jgi:hypothetical protein
MPTNGVYMPSANSVAIAANGAQSLLFTSGGVAYFQGPSSSIAINNGIAIEFSNNGANYISAKGGSSSFFVFETNSTEYLRIAPNGALGLSGANYGSSGQVLTSNGSGSAPTWQAASGGGSADPIETMLFC